MPIENYQKRSWGWYDPTWCEVIWHNWILGDQQRASILLNLWWSLNLPCSNQAAALLFPLVLWEHISSLKQCTLATSSKLDCSDCSTPPRACKAFKSLPWAVVRTSGGTGGAPTLIRVGAWDASDTFRASRCFLTAGSACQSPLKILPEAAVCMRTADWALPSVWVTFLLSSCLSGFQGI